jgi:hypothetical protein
MGDFKSKPAFDRKILQRRDRQKSASAVNVPKSDDLPYCRRYNYHSLTIKNYIVYTCHIPTLSGLYTVCRSFRLVTYTDGVVRSFD